MLKESDAKVQKNMHVAEFFYHFFLIYINIFHFLPLTPGYLFSQFTKKDNPLPNAGSDSS